MNSDMLLKLVFESTQNHQKLRQKVVKFLPLMGREWISILTVL
uniref:Homeobox protein HD1 n=1 Tax=Rhizophora mucronata TaxID=61149 RepID=A0A2P2LEV6_RHIMU